MTDNVIYGIDFQAKRNKEQDDMIDRLLAFDCRPEVLDILERHSRNGFNWIDTAPSEYQAPVKDGA